MAACRAGRDCRELASPQGLPVGSPSPAVCARGLAPPLEGELGAAVGTGAVGSRVGLTGEVPVSNSPPRRQGTRSVGAGAAPAEARPCDAVSFRSVGQDVACRVLTRRLSVMSGFRLQSHTHLTQMRSRGGAGPECKGAACVLSHDPGFWGAVMLSFLKQAPSRSVSRHQTGERV